jgi:hypothetical protein
MMIATIMSIMRNFQWDTHVAMYFMNVAVISPMPALFCGYALDFTSWTTPLDIIHIAFGGAITHAKMAYFEN